MKTKTKPKTDPAVRKLLKRAFEWASVPINYTVPEITLSDEDKEVLWEEAAKYRE